MGKKRIGGVMVSMLTLSAVDRGFAEFALTNKTITHSLINEKNSKKVSNFTL